MNFSSFFKISNLKFSVFTNELEEEEIEPPRGIQGRISTASRTLLSAKGKELKEKEQQNKREKKEKAEQKKNAKNYRRTQFNKSTTKISIHTKKLKSCNNRRVK